MARLAHFWHSDSSSPSPTPPLPTPPQSQSKPPSPSIPHPCGTAFFSLPSSRRVKITLLSPATRPFHLISNLHPEHHFSKSMVDLEIVWGGDKTVPEFQCSNKVRNLFPTDIYYLGNVIKEHFLEVSQQGRSPYLIHWWCSSNLSVNWDLDSWSLSLMTWPNMIHRNTPQ